MNEDTIKLLVIGAGGLVLGILFFGRKGSAGGSDVEATLESMRISSATNIAYAQAGVESTRIQADLTAQKDRNRSTIQIAGIENDTARYAVQRKADNELYGIQTGRAMFERALSHELRMSVRENIMRKFELGNALKTEREKSRREIELEKIYGSTARYAADRGLVIEQGRQRLDERALENQYVQGLVSVIPNLVDSFGRGVQYVQSAFGYQPAPQFLPPVGYNTIAQRSQYPQGSGGVQPHAYPGYNDPTPQFTETGVRGQQIATNVAAGAIAGTAVYPGIGTAVGAAAGAGSSFS